MHSTQTTYEVLECNISQKPSIEEKGGGRLSGNGLHLPQPDVTAQCLDLALVARFRDALLHHFSTRSHVQQQKYGSY